MKSITAFVAAMAIAAPSLVIPQLAAAQAYHSYGSYDPCRAAQRSAANNGTVTGGILGAVVGSAVAGRGSRLGGAIVGGTVGAVAGHQIGKSSVRCASYPRRIGYHRPNCRWVEEYYRGRNHDFEVCRDPDGVWRPSGRA
ncbi:MAG: glycine zipper 2TM domain-containing protein [Caulobacteraceae bacterium]